MLSSRSTCSIPRHTGILATQGGTLNRKPPVTLAFSKSEGRCVNPKISTKYRFENRRKFSYYVVNGLAETRQIVPKIYHYCDLRSSQSA